MLFLHVWCNNYYILCFIDPELEDDINLHFDEDAFQPAAGIPHP
jgi:hypothetical protein